MKNKDIQTPKPKRKGLAVTASVTEANIEAFRALAGEAVGPKRESSFASIVVNLVVECAKASGADWDSFKTGLPGYKDAMRDRRIKAALDAFQSPRTIKDRYDELSEAERREVDAKVKEIEERKGPTKPKSRAS